MLLIMQECGQLVSVGKAILSLYFKGHETPHILVCVCSVLAPNSSCFLWFCDAADALLTSCLRLKLPL